MKLWKWQKGRQGGCDYSKFPLWFFRIGKFGFDAYILKYQPDSRLPVHTDPVDGKHWRLNIKLKGTSTFFLEHHPILKRVILFRPDIKAHQLIVHSKGCTKLSFGFVKFN